MSARQLTCAAGSVSTSPAAITRGRINEMVALAGPGRSRRVRARAGSRCPRAAAAGGACPAVQPAVALPAPLVVAGAEQRGVPSIRGGPNAATRPRDRPVPVPSRRRRHRRAAGPRSPECAPAPRGSARSALHGPACPQREVSPCPAARGVMRRPTTPRAPLAPAALIDGVDNAALAAAVSRSPTWPVVALRDRRPAARPPVAARSTGCGAASGCGRWPSWASWSPRRPTATAAGTSP